MGFLSSVGGMVGGVVGGMFGGPIGAQIGSQVGAGLGGMLENLIGQHGQPNVQSAMNNNMMGSLVGQLGQAIQCAPGIPQFARDEMCQALQDVHKGCPPEPTPSGCQRDTDDSMSSLIDKIVNKVVDQIMEKIQAGGCQSSGSLQDMVRQAIEDVVRETIGGGADEGGCAASGGSQSGAVTASGGTSSESSDVGSTSNVTSSIINECGKDEEEAKSKSKGSGSWLVALAKAMGQMTGDHLARMMDAQNAMEDSKVDENSAEFKGASEEKQREMKEEAGRVFTEQQAVFQAESKLFAMCSEATSTALKSVGDGLSSMARKQ
ncbi:MAG: hypothetical protein JAZ11_20735 [Candidatus Thiodiazotropha lotti]|nr:hypothetical protein [Candidatus Thiodiazotropha lotti]